MCNAAQPSKEDVREWLRRRRSAQSLPELEQIRRELGWVWCSCPLHRTAGGVGFAAFASLPAARIAAIPGAAREPTVPA